MSKNKAIVAIGPPRKPIFIDHDRVLIGCPPHFVKIKVILPLTDMFEIELSEFKKLARFVIDKTQGRVFIGEQTAIREFGEYKTFMTYDVGFENEEDLTFFSLCLPKEWTIKNYSPQSGPDK